MKAPWKNFIDLNGRIFWCEGEGGVLVAFHQKQRFEGSRDRVLHWLQKQGLSQQLAIELTVNQK